VTHWFRFKGRASPPILPITSGIAGWPTQGDRSPGWIFEVGGYGGIPTAATDPWLSRLSGAASQGPTHGQSHGSFWPQARLVAGFPCMSDTIETENVGQSRLVRAFQPQGLLLVKSRESKPPAFNPRGYALVDASTNTRLAGDRQALSVLGASANHGSCHSLNDVEGYLHRRLS
jgi:hypothetical protein